MTTVQTVLTENIVNFVSGGSVNRVSVGDGVKLIRIGVGVNLVVSVVRGCWLQYVLVKIIRRLV